MNSHRPYSQQGFLWNHLIIIFLAFLAFLALVAALPRHEQEASAAPLTASGRPHETVLAPHALAGATLLTSSNKGYLSAQTREHTPFTHLLLRAEFADHAPHDAIPEARTSTDGETWSAWQTLPLDDDLWVPEDGEEVVWSSILYAGEEQRFWQVRLRPPENAPPLPEVRQLTVSTVDARYGSADPRPRYNSDNPRLTNGNGLSRPPVVTRTAWGCPDGQATRATPGYRYVSHMVVHHTAGPGTLRSSEETWADRVRAIWSFHTYTRGWGDIGYNYIISPDGTIYEGRGGGDNVVGFHDTANYGSMGVSLIGTYENVNPAPAMQDSLVGLLAWKANQNDISPHGSSFYYGCSISSYCWPHTTGAVIDHIAGHRQVTPGHTTCPGDQVINLLPSIRDRVLAYIENGGAAVTQPDNGDLVIEELEDSFTTSEANWYRAPCGYEGHTFYTYATDTEAESTNSATWKPTISESGNYRVYAHIPQGCGLGIAPYASTSATYQVHHAGGVAEARVDHNTAEEWVELGTYAFEEGSSGFVTLSDLSGEPYSLRRVIFFDAVKWVPEDNEVPEGEVELLSVSYDQTSIAAGNLLKVFFTVRNNSSETISTQNPQADLLPDGSYDPTSGYVYNNDECILGDGTENYPAYPKEHDTFRVTLGMADRKVETCAGEVSNYPWRWGLNGSLAPGETRTITGYVRFRKPLTATLQAGLIQEYVQYHVQGMATTPLTVTEENQAPLPATFETDSLSPTAHVYHIGDMPDNMLVRSNDPLAVPRGQFVGSFAWDGQTIEWGEGGPLGVKDRFIVEQTRIFSVPVEGNYAFRTTSNGKSWLWVDGKLAVVNSGMLYPPDMTADITATVPLSSGLHVLSFKYFELTDTSMAGYAVRAPGASEFAPPLDASWSTTPTISGTFTLTPSLVLAADDLGGSGVAKIRYSWDGGTTWEEVSVEESDAMAVLHAPPEESTSLLRYQAVDQAGNTSPVNKVHIQIEEPAEPAEPTLKRIFLPYVAR
jgi:hypothetical protein